MRRVGRAASAANGFVGKAASAARPTTSLSQIFIAILEPRLLGRPDSGNTVVQLQFWPDQNIRTLDGIPAGHRWNEKRNAEEPNGLRQRSVQILKTAKILCAGQAGACVKREGGPQGRIEPPPHFNFQSRVEGLRLVRQTVQLRKSHRSSPRRRLTCLAHRADGLHQNKACRQIGRRYCLGRWLRRDDFSTASRTFSR
jgi:hypothetical protein